jgi:hypothetical protein
LLNDTLERVDLGAVPGAIRVIVANEVYELLPVEAVTVSRVDLSGGAYCYRPNAIARRRWPHIGMKPTRVPLSRFPDVVLHAEEAAAKRHPLFAAAKTGDILAAGIVVAGLINPESVERLRALLDGRHVELLPIHALEIGGVNEIPAALARELGRRLELPISTSVVQSNAVGHTGADGFHRLANQALFEGAVTRGARYPIVDDFVGQGGTLANLIGFVCSEGAAVVAATALTGKPYSAKLAPADGQISALRDKHGRALEEWWIEGFGFDFDRVTRSEARYLENTADAHTIRDRIVAARLEHRAQSGRPR